MKKKLFGLLILTSLFLTACFWRQEVQTSQVGLELSDGVSVSAVHGSGRYSSGSWYAQLAVIDVSNKTVDWLDTSLVTSDKQPITLKITMNYARCRAEDKVRNLFNDYRVEAFDDVALERLALSPVPSVAKSITTEYSLDQMLGIAEGDEAVGRQVVESALSTRLEPELQKLNICLTNVRISDIDPGEAYLASLGEKAQAQIQREIAIEQTQTLVQQLEAEKAQTDINIEQARRENLVNEELAKAYELNPSLVEIRKLELLSTVLNDQDLVIYVPEGTDISTVLLGQPNGGLVPVPSSGE